MQLILGSQSPRRQEILGYFSLPFKIIPSDFDERSLAFKGAPAAYAKLVAKEKARSLQKLYPDTPILTADTIVFFEGRIFPKPKHANEAVEMLTFLAGKRHEVYTGVCIAWKGKTLVKSERTSVWLNLLTHKEILQYHKNQAHLDKAGAYAIQKSGSIIVKRIKGCYYNVMGLPVNTVRELLQKIGIDLWQYL